MAKYRVLSEQEYEELLRAKFAECENKMEKIRIEMNASKALYQGISSHLTGGVDTALLKSLLFGPGTQETDPISIEGLDLVKAAFFLHSKLCVSDPMVTTTPLNQDSKTVRAAEITNAYIPFLNKHMRVRETLEAGTYLNVVVHGTGVNYIGWDKDGGEYPVEIDEATGEITMEGDFEFRDVDPARFYIDANAKVWKDAKYCIEEREIPYEEALATFYVKGDELATQEIHRKIKQSYENPEQGISIIEDRPVRKTTVTIYEYWEKGGFWNGFNGAHVTFINKIQPKILIRKKHPFKHLSLPYEVLTDIDIPGSPYGMSRLTYCFQIQKAIDMLMSLFLNNTSLFGGVRMMAPEGSMSDDRTNNQSIVDFYNAGSGAKADYFRPIPVTSDVWQGYKIMKAYIDNVYGMNEFSQGQINRELSSFAVQIALEVDDKFRIRLFHKKQDYLAGNYKMALELTKQYMPEPRKLKIIGVENYLGDEYFKAADIEGDYVLQVDYGTYIPIDPAARKQQILEFIQSGFYEKAGGSLRKIAKLLVDGSMLDVKSKFENPYSRQKSEIDRMINGEEVSVEEWNNDAIHSECIDDFTQEETFEKLPPETKMRIWNHGKQHVASLAKKMAAANPQQPGGMPGAPGAPGAAPGGMPGAPGAPGGDALAKLMGGKGEPPVGQGPGEGQSKPSAPMSPM